MGQANEPPHSARGSHHPSPRMPGTPSTPAPPSTPIRLGSFGSSKGAVESPRAFAVAVASVATPSRMRSGSMSLPMAKVAYPLLQGASTELSGPSRKQVVPPGVPPLSLPGKPMPSQLSWGSLPASMIYDPVDNGLAGAKAMQSPRQSSRAFQPRSPTSSFGSVGVEDDMRDPIRY